MFFKYYDLHYKSKQIYSTNEFRNLVGSYFNSAHHDKYNIGQQEDCFLFFNDTIDILQFIDINVNELFKFNNIIDTSCTKCKKASTFIEAGLTSIDIHLNPNNKYTDLIDSLKFVNQSERKCEVCKNVTEHNDHSKLLFSSENKFVLVYVHSFTRNAKETKKIQSMIKNCNLKDYYISCVDRNLFNIKAIIIRQSNEINSGHFKIWVKHIYLEKWLYINDTQVSAHNNMHESLNNVVSIVFERKVV